VSPEERRRSAYHESGHALVSLLTPGADPVRKVSIVPRGRALGVTVQSPVDDRQMFTEQDLLARITTAVGGRAAEALVFGEISTGAESDLLDATGLAREMVVRWGMSPAVGPLNFGRGDDGGPLSALPYSPATAELIDAEMRRIVEQSMTRASTLLRGNRDKLDRLASALLEAESMEGDEVLRAVGMDQRAAAG
jgi:cell division protease FtsH